MDVCSEHDFGLSSVVQKIREVNAKTIVVQLPNGFQKCFDYIAQKIKDYVGAQLKIVLSLNPSYGSCLVDEHTAEEIGADIIIHFGHVIYPLYTPRIRTLFIPVEYKGVDINKIKMLFKNICTDYSKRICIASSSQHIELSKDIELSDGCSYVYKGVAFGCIPVDVSGCDALVVVAGGRFSCLSQYLALITQNSNLPIYCLDPYSYSLWRPENEVNKFIKVRMWKIFKAMEGKRWLIIMGFYGQARHKIVDVLANKLRSRGFEVSIAKVLKLDRDTIVNLGKGFDVIVVASCPYLAFDFYDMDPPILTIGEAFMVSTGNTERYVYPW